MGPWWKLLNLPSCFICPVKPIANTAMLEHKESSTGEMKYVWRLFHLYHDQGLHVCIFIFKDTTARSHILYTILFGHLPNCTNLQLSKDFAVLFVLLISVSFRLVKTVQTFKKYFQVTLFLKKLGSSPKSIIFEVLLTHLLLT